LPIIYGDWSVSVEQGGASVPAIPVNGNDPDVNGETGNTEVVELVISENVNTYFDSTEVYLLRNDTFYNFDSGDVVNLNGDKNYFELRQSASTPAGITLVEGALYSFKRGDKIFCKVKGKAITGDDDNLVLQAKDILKEYKG